MNAKRWVTWAVAVLALLGVVTGAQATALPAPSTGVSVFSLASFTGTVVGDTTGAGYSVPGGTGTVREWVVRDATGGLCAGCLSFVYQVHVTTGVVTRISGAQYDALTVDVKHFIGPADPPLTGSLGGDFGANEADRSADGNTVGFNFTSPILATFDSFLEIANTDATTFTGGIITVSGADGSTNIGGFAPVAAAVPEPATMFLIGSGLVALGVWRRRS